MKDYKEMDRLVFDFGDDIKHFAQNHGGTMPPAIKSQLQDLMFTSFAKEIDAITEREELEIKYKKKFYNKLLHAKYKLAKRDRADAWFDKVFQKYFNRGMLEHLLVYAINFLYKKDLFIPKRLFAQINNDELLGQFVVSACEYLGWTATAAEPVEPITCEEQPTDNEQAETAEEPENMAENKDEASAKEEPQKEEEAAEVLTEEEKPEDVAENGEKDDISPKSEEKPSYWNGRRKGENKKTF